MVKWLKKFDHFIDLFCYGGLILSIFLMVAFGISSIILRWKGQSLSWIDPVIRHSVFLSAFLGGTMAAGRKGHIAIDVLSQWWEIKGRVAPKKKLEQLTSLVSFLILIWLGYSAIGLVNLEREFGQSEIPGISSAVLVSIIPVGFFLIAYRFLFLFITSFKHRRVA